jgi:hypothetical protein
MPLKIFNSVYETYQYLVEHANKTQNLIIFWGEK